jgi:hypothetical protein
MIKYNFKENNCWTIKLESKFITKMQYLFNTLMPYTGRLTLLNSVINSLPMYAMCSLKIPITIFIHFEKSGRQFLWADREDKIQGKCLASWEMICRPKDQGGLGVLDLRIQNKAILIKNLHKFYNQKDIPWVKLLWQAY